MASIFAHPVRKRTTRRKVGTVFELVGWLLLAAALALFLHNSQESENAREFTHTLMPQIVDSILERQEVVILENQNEPDTEHIISDLLDEPKAMTVVDIDGYGYIGFLGMPSLDLELPVMSDWSYPQLRIAPCRYWGNLFTDDLVIMAHNYRWHFGSLSKLAYGDTVTFTDMHGETTEYEVKAVEVLAPSAVEEITSGNYDLTLFTCTYGGRSRIAVNCDRK